MSGSMPGSTPSHGASMSVEDPRKEPKRRLHLTTATVSGLRAEHQEVTFNPVLFDEQPR